VAVAECSSVVAFEQLLTPYLGPSTPSRLPPSLLAEAAERLAGGGSTLPIDGRAATAAASRRRLARALPRAMLAQCPYASAEPVARLLWALARAQGRPVGPEEEEQLEEAGDDGSDATSHTNTLRALAWHLVHVALRRPDAQGAPGRMAAQTAWAYVRLGLLLAPPALSSQQQHQQPCSWPELVSLLGERAADFNALDCANAAWALGRVAQLRQRGAAFLPEAASSSPVLSNATTPLLTTDELRALRAVQIRAARVSGRLDPRGVSGLLWSAAVAGECDGRLAEALARRAAETAERFAPQSLSLALWASAKLRLYDARALGALRLRLLNIARDLGPQALANASWALATLFGGGGGGAGAFLVLAPAGNSSSSSSSNSGDRAVLSALVRAALGSQGQSRPSPVLAMSPQGLANFCWALARLGWWVGRGAEGAAVASAAATPSPDHALLVALTQQATRNLHRSGPQECCNLVWSLATLWSRRQRWWQVEEGEGGGGPELRALLRAAGARLEEIEGALGPADLAQIGWALATILQQQGAAVDAWGENQPSAAAASRRALLVLWREAGRRPHLFSPAELSVVAWSLATTAAPMLQPLDSSSPAEEEREHTGGVSPAAVRATARSLGRAAFARLASARLGGSGDSSSTIATSLAGFSPRGLATLAWALARLGAADAQLLHAASGALLLRAGTGAGSSALPMQDALMLAVAAARTPGFRDDAGCVAALVRASAEARVLAVAAEAAPLSAAATRSPGAWATLAQAVARLQARETWGRGISFTTDPALAALLAETAAADLRASSRGGMAPAAAGALLLALARLGLLAEAHPRQVERLLSALDPCLRGMAVNSSPKAALAVARGLGLVLAGDGGNCPSPSSAIAARRALSALECAFWRADTGAWDLPPAAAARLHAPLERGLVQFACVGGGEAAAAPPRGLARLRDACRAAHLAGHDGWSSSPSL
jgi:hypothetical protein